VVTRPCSQRAGAAVRLTHVFLFVAYGIGRAVVEITVLRAYERCTRNATHARVVVGIRERVRVGVAQIRVFTIAGTTRTRHRNDTTRARNLRTLAASRTLIKRGFGRRSDGWYRRRFVRRLGRRFVCWRGRGVCSWGWRRRAFATRTIVRHRTVVRRQTQARTVEIVRTLDVCVGSIAKNTLPLLFFTAEAVLAGRRTVAIRAVGTQHGFTRNTTVTIGENLRIQWIAHVLVFDVSRRTRVIVGATLATSACTFVVCRTLINGWRGRWGD